MDSVRFGAAFTIEDLNLLKVRGQVEAWLQIFRRFTEHFAELFAWLDWRWMRLDRAEVDFLVVATVVFSSLTSSYLTVDEKFKDRLIAGQLFGLFFTGLVLFILVLVPCSLLPGRLGLIFSGGYTLWYFGLGLRGSHENKKFPVPRRVFLEQFAGVVSVLFILLIANEIFS